MFDSKVQVIWGKGMVFTAFAMAPKKKTKHVLSVIQLGAHEKYAEMCLPKLNLPTVEMKLYQESP